MNSIKDAKSKITWKMPGATEYVLEEGDSQLATIKLDDNGGVANTADGMWTFHKHGFLNPHVLVRDSASKKQVGRFDAAMAGGGILEMSDGRHFKLMANTWNAEWRWRATAGDELAILTYSGFAVDSSPEGRVEVLEEGREWSHLPMLVVLGCYLIHLIAESEFK